MWHIRIPWPWQVVIERRRFMAVQGWLPPAQVAQENRLTTDTTGVQFRRIHKRRKMFFPWPRYPIPLHKLVDLATPDEVRRWHEYWLRPRTEAEQPLVDHCLSLFLAAAAYAQAQELNPVRVLLDMAVSDPHEVLTALDGVEASRPFMRQFTRGASGEVVVWDEGIAAAYTFFTTRLHPYKAHLSALAPVNTQDASQSMLGDWQAEGRTLYVLYEPDELAQASGLWPMLVNGLIEHQANLWRKPINYFPSPTKTEIKPPSLVAFPLVLAWPGMLKDLVNWRARGMTALLYAASLPQLHTMLRQDGAEALLAQCPHQVWGIPNDVMTAGYMAHWWEGMWCRGRSTPPAKPLTNNTPHLCARYSRVIPGVGTRPPCGGQSIFWPNQKGGRWLSRGSISGGCLWLNRWVMCQAGSHVRSVGWK